MGSALFVAPREAAALPLLGFSASLRGLYGVTLGDQAVNPYGPGLGLRAGLTLPVSLYVGASLDVFAGEDDRGLAASRIQGMGHVGYDVGLGLVTLRPTLAAGFSHASFEVAGSEFTEGDFLLAPGVEANLGLGLIALGAELRYNKVFAEGDADGLIAGVGLGLSF